MAYAIYIANCTIGQRGDRPQNGIWRPRNARNPACPGNTLVVPRAHHRDLGEIPAETAAHVMRAAVEVSRRLVGALRAPGVNLWHASGETAWQSVLHFHLHVLPRFEPTELTPPWTEVEHPVESLKGLAEEIRAWC
ncbi:HIT family protein [Nonomuraea sp. NPDC049269]|uniref:HIT family protein n=1 Tax=Nonomuraea sp. NPDC049269 TaxID=3364349 RepID=UPI00371CEAFA